MFNVCHIMAAYQLFKMAAVTAINGYLLIREVPHSLY
jgi:hypothetical protein